MLSPIETGIDAAWGALGIGGLTWGACTYAALWPKSQLFGKTLTAPRNPGELALTFDDGPNPAWTPQLLDLLSKHNVKATFFMVGSFAKAEPALVRRVAAAGHLIGNHSWSHPNLALTPAGKVTEELTNTTHTLQQITGKPVRFFRPPFGARRPFVLTTARSLGMIPVTWNAMTNDWEYPSADAIALRLARTIDRLERKGSAANIVLHDGGHRGLGANRGPSVAAAGQLLERYKENHRFLTLDSWPS